MRWVEKNAANEANFRQGLFYMDGDGTSHLITRYAELHGPQRDSLLAMLIEEQGGVCAYCHQSITIAKATIEHFICQSHNDRLDVNYWNLFAVCLGNEGTPRLSHCDKHRANQRKNEYFFPFVDAMHCRTVSAKELNPFFDAQINRAGITGLIVPRQNSRVVGYTPVQPTIAHAIASLNLNADKLVNARTARWLEVEQEQQETGLAWPELFNQYLVQHPRTNFHEFVLLAIRKQF